MRSAKSFRNPKDLQKYILIMSSLAILTFMLIFLLIKYKNPVPIDSPSFLPVVRRRIDAVIAMLIAATCQSLATVSFQSITSNRIITPSLLGFEAVYSAIHTIIMYIFGVNVFLEFNGVDSFVIQIGIMVLVSLLLYGFMISGKYGNLHFMLLIGVVIGTGLKSFSAFLRRLLSPSEFDLLQARLFASVNNSDSRYFAVAIPIVIIAGILVVLFSNRLNVLTLGRDTSINLGLKHNKSAIYVLILVAILISVSTALVGPLTFFGFLVATLTYEFCPSFDHKFIFPMSLFLGYVVLLGAYFLMYHVFSAMGVVTIIIELFGGILFLFVIMRKESL
ncbi:iron chelate uptake ABC transporter family permease subunit [Peptoniphilus sp. MSJ-1]|uniref:Iron chelate uptake ABC transporter family permease subunit n=1 Tax=Peptoniphilus ovalis TaxID=2841503 RepID=A0ABS6FK28_9FIRM|nr:iron chelate uptake ABC transporter family permease subunit [Peptoniphilus ovalis]MBU5669823.1 iron chelate uptake ABC transporter family permease subunit [Peptoniphilus ovalis]